MKLRKFMMTLLALGLSFCMMFALAGCGSTAEESSDETEAEEAEADDEDDSDDDDSSSSSNLILSLDDGTEIELSQFGEDEAYIYGKFIYETDGSMWVFGGDTLSVAFYDTDGELDMDLYAVTFYQAADEDSDYANYLYVVLTDVFEGSSACWYALNVTDDDDNLVAVALVNPSDEDVIYYLSVYEDEDDEDEDEDEE